MEIMLLRHGESEGNAQGRMQGRRDFPLSALGREQAARAGAFVASHGPFAAVYASPLKRAFETASIVAAQGVRPEPAVDEDLPEIGAGALEGMNEAEIRAAHPVFMERSLTETGDFSDYGGESYADVQARLRRLMARLEARHRDAGDRVLLVGHGGFHYQLAKALLCEPVPRVCILKMGNCTASLLRLRERRGLYIAELVFHVPVELMAGAALPASGEGAARLFR
jgi:broad specificity phosphatase PhoE